MPNTQFLRCIQRFAFCSPLATSSEIWHVHTCRACISSARRSCPYNSCMSIQRQALHACLFLQRQALHTFVPIHVMHAYLAPGASCMHVPPAPGAPWHVHACLCNARRSMACLYMSFMSIQRQTLMLCPCMSIQRQAVMSIRGMHVDPAPGFHISSARCSCPHMSCMAIQRQALHACLSLQRHALQTCLSLQRQALYAHVCVHVHVCMRVGLFSVCTCMPVADADRSSWT